MKTLLLHFEPQGACVIPTPASIPLTSPRFFTQQKPGRTIRGGRRRESPGAPQGRAEAPRRDRPAPRPLGGGASGGGYSGQPPSGSGGGGFPSGGGGLPNIPLSGGAGLLVLLAVICLGALFFVMGGNLGDLLGGGELSQPESSLPEQGSLPQPGGGSSGGVLALPTATPLPLPQIQAGTSGEAGAWTVMLYQDADDRILEQDIYLDINEAERVGSTSQVNIVAQVDRFQGGYSGDGNWTSTRRYLLRQDTDLNRLGAQEVQDIGEANMSDAQTLVDFVSWAVTNYPADKYVLILSDHGLGWPGGWSDPTASGSGAQANALGEFLGDQLYLDELDAALGQIRQQTGIDRFEVIGLDACLMASLEVFSALQPHARYAVASEETEPALGWAYTSFLYELAGNPSMSGADLSRAIVESYIRDDQRIVDDQARAEFMGQSSPLGGFFGGLGGGGSSYDQVRNQLEQGITLTAVDLAQLPALHDAVNQFAHSMQAISQRPAAQSRQYAQSFTSVFGKEVPPSYIDLGHFSRLMIQAGNDRQVGQAATDVVAAIGNAVVAEKHGAGKPGATGVSIYFPNSQLYSSRAAGAQTYVQVARRFAEASLWDDFLAFHYTGQQFDLQPSGVAVPSRSITAPGAGQIQVSPLRLSAESISVDDSVLMSADVSGENVGYIKLFVGFYDQNANSIFVADTDYIDSPNTRQETGVYYPDWGEGDFTLEFEWQPVVFAISDGTDQVVALFTPREYGLTRADAVYTVDGLYTYGATGETRNARLQFRGGVLRQVFGYTGQDFNGAPREIIPSSGDTFTILERWMDLDAQGKVSGVASEQGDTLTFGNQMFEWVELFAAPGEYIIGFIVEDLDGNPIETYNRVTVQ